MIISRECKKNYDSFMNLLKDKRIIIVGPSAALMKNQLGDYIDSFDIIVRLNNSFPLYSEIKKNLGSRTDILYYVSGNIDKHFEYIKRKKKINVLKNDEIKFIIFKKGYNSKSTKYQKIFDNFYKKYFNEVKIFPMKKVTNNLKRRLKSDPNMGVLAIVHLLTSELKELYIIGSDFYKYPHYPQYSILPNYRFDIKKRILKNKKTGWKQKINHNIEIQLEYLKLISIKDKRLHLGNTLKNMILQNSLKINKSIKLGPVIIPKIIHMIWIGGLMPEEYKYNIKTFTVLNPSWKVKVWTNEGIKKETFINQKIIDKMPTFAAKVDIIRLEILYKYGGLYTDCDSVCLKPIDDLINGKFCFGMHDNNGFVANGTLGCKKNHPAFKELVYSLSEHVLNLKKYEGNNYLGINTFFVTGTKYITPILKKYKDFDLIDENKKRGERKYICSTYEKDLTKCFIYHYLAKSWHKNKYIKL